MSDNERFFGDKLLSERRFTVTTLRDEDIEVCKVHVLWDGDMAKVVYFRPQFDQMFFDNVPNPISHADYDINNKAAKLVADKEAAILFMKHWEVKPDMANLFFEDNIWLKKKIT